MPVITEGVKILLLFAMLLCKPAVLIVIGFATKVDYIQNQTIDETQI